MTRFLPIDRPLVYGDIIACQTDPDYDTGDRNVFLRMSADEPDGFTYLQITNAGADDIRMRMGALGVGWLLVVEE